MKRILVGLLCILCLIGFGVIALLQYRRPVLDRATYDAIELGMPEDEALKLAPIRPGAQGRRALTCRCEILGEAGTLHTQLNDNEVVVTPAEDGSFTYVDATTREELGRLRMWVDGDY